MKAHKSRYGAGSIRKRDEGRWELRVLAGRDPVTGKHRYVSHSVRCTKREAEAVMAALLVKVSQGGGRQGTDATMGHLIEQWLDLRKDSLSVTTYEGYLETTTPIDEAFGAAVQKRDSQFPDRDGTGDVALVGAVVGAGEVEVVAYTPSTEWSAVRKHEHSTVPAGTDHC